MTINKPAHTTYGDGKEAAATVTSTLDSSITKSTITYKKGNDILDTAPTDAGTYTASITVGEGKNAKTASVEYSISAQHIDIDRVIKEDFCCQEQNALGRFFAQQMRLACLIECSIAAKTG